LKTTIFSNLKKTLTPTTALASINSKVVGLGPGHKNFSAAAASRNEVMSPARCGHQNHLELFDESVATLLADAGALDEHVGHVGALHVAQQVLQPNAVQRQQRVDLGPMLRFLKYYGWKIY
jgi:hypothetical protein